MYAVKTVPAMDARSFGFFFPPGIAPPSMEAFFAPEDDAVARTFSF